MQNDLNDLIPSKKISVILNKSQLALDKVENKHLKIEIIKYVN